MKIIAIKDMSAGNESVGEMWKETKIFEHTDSVIEIMRWAGIKKNVSLSIPENEQDDFPF